MSSQEIEKDRIMNELMACQLRVNELERTAASAREQDLKAARDEFEGLFELSPDALVLVDRQGRVVRVNASTERLFGYTRQEMMGREHDALFVPESSRARHNAEMKRFMQNPRVRVMGMGLELRGRKKDGTEFPADIDLGPLDIGGGFFVLAVVRDATRRKRLEVDLQQSEQRYRDLVEASPDGIIIVSDGRIVFSNATGPGLLGLESVDHAMGRPVMDFFHPEYRATAQERIRRTIEEKRMAPLIRGRLLRPDGMTVYVDLISMPFTHQGKAATLIIIRDVTERQRAEDAIREQQERFRTIVHTALDGFWMNDLDGRLLYVNDSYCAISGYSCEELLAMRITDLEAAETPEQTSDHVRKIKRTGGDRFETQHRRKDGTVIDIEVSATYLDIDGGRFFVFLRDITERKRAQQALADSERRFRSALDNMLEACVILDHNWRYLYANDSAVRMGRRSLEQRIGRTLFQIYPGIEEQDVYTHLKRCMEERVPDRYVTEFTFPEGIKAWLEMLVSPVPEGIMLVYLDISERKRAEDALKESEEKYRTLFTGMSAGYAYCQIVTGEKNEPVDFVILEANEAFENLTGLKKAATIGKRITVAAPEVRELNPELITAFGKVALTGQPSSFELFFGPLKAWFSVVSYCPKRGYFVALFDDIGQRKRLEEELDSYRGRLETVVAQRTAEFAQANETLSREVDEHRRTEEGLSLRASILDNAREAVFLVNPQGDFAYANEAAIRTYGYTRDEFLTMNLSQLLRPEDASVIPDRLKTVLRTGQLEVETVHVRKDASLMPVEVRHSLIKTLHGQFIVSVMRDATTRFQLRSLLDRMPVVTWTTDLQLRLTSTAGAGLETLGMKPDQGVGLPFGEFLEANGWTGDVLAAHQGAMKGKLEGFSFKIAEQGRSFMGRAAPLRDIGGEISGTIGTAMEVPE